MACVTAQRSHDMPHAAHVHKLLITSATLRSSSDESDSAAAGSPALLAPLASAGVPAPPPSFFAFRA